MNEYRVIILRKSIIKVLNEPRIQGGLNNHYFLSLFWTENEIKKTFEKFQNNDLEKHEPNRIFNYYEYYFTYLEGNEIKYYFDYNNELNNIEKLLYSYYKYLYQLYKSKEPKNNYSEFEKVKKNFSDAIKHFEKKKGEEINEIKKKAKNCQEKYNKLYEIQADIIKACIEKIINYLKLLSDVYSFKYKKKIYFDDINITHILDQKVKKCDINKDELIIFKKKLIELFLDKKDFLIILRLLYLEKNYLKDIKKDINNYITEFKEKKNKNEEEKIIQKFLNFYDSPILKTEIINSVLFDKIKKIKNKDDFVTILKGKYLNNLIYNDLFSKELIKISLDLFEWICYPLSNSLFYLTIIYNGLISEKFENEKLKFNDIFYKNEDLFFLNEMNKKFSANNWNENEDLEFKRIIFKYLYSYLYHSYNIYRVEQLKTIPLFHLLILKIFLWKFNVEKGNDAEIINTYYKYKVLLIKLNIPIDNEVIFDIVLLIHEIVGDSYLKLKNYRKAKMIYQSMTRDLNEQNENSQNKKDSLFIIIQNKIKICKYFCGHNTFNKKKNIFK